MDGWVDGPLPPRFGVEFVSRATDGKTHAKGDFRVLLLSNQAQRSTRDGQGQSLRKAPGIGAFLSFMGPWRHRKRHGLMLASDVSHATGRAEREDAIDGPLGSLWLTCDASMVRHWGDAQSINARKRIEW